MFKFLLRKILRIAYPIAKAYWFVVRPKSVGAKCLVVNKDKVLLIRHSFSPERWSLPGGRVKKNEKPIEAVKRELKEEVGLSVEPELLETLRSEREYKKDTLHLFIFKNSTTETEIDFVEVIEAEWFSVDKLPENLGWLAEQGVKLYKAKISKTL